VAGLAAILLGILALAVVPPGLDAGRAVNLERGRHSQREHPQRSGARLHAREPKRCMTQKEAHEHGKTRIV
jgi:hypothetical protein